MLYGLINAITLSLSNKGQTRKESLIERNAREYVNNLRRMKEFSKKNPEILDLPEGLERSIYMDKVELTKEKRYNEIRENVVWSALIGAGVVCTLIGLGAAYYYNY